MVQDAADVAVRGSRPLSFAFVVNNYPPRIGGVELHVRNLARHLHDLGHRVVVITLADDTGTADEDGIEVIRLREHLRVADVLGFPSLGTTARVARVLRAHDVDVVSVHTRFFPMSWVGVRAAARVGAVVVHTEHGSDHVVSDSAVIRIASRAVDGTVGRSVLRRADGVLGVSESVTAFVARLSGRRDAHVFYNAIDPAPEGIDRSRRARLVFVGRLVPGKGADVFVDTVAALAAEGRAFDAEIVGDGPIHAEIAARVERAGLAERVTLRGRIPVEDVSRALAGSILVNPTTLSEGFQTTLLEVLEVGGSVVSYDVPGAGSLAREGFPVTVVERDDADGLLAGVRSMLDAQWPVRPMDRWYWAARADQYVRIARDTLATRSDAS